VPWENVRNLGMLKIERSIHLEEYQPRNGEQKSDASIRNKKAIVFLNILVTYY
jgi:hypothetical protein